jgi:hypothetical protein
LSSSGGGGSTKAKITIDDDDESWGERGDRVLEYVLEYL